MGQVSVRVWHASGDACGLVVCKRMFPEEITRWLRENEDSGYASYRRSNRSSDLEMLAELGIPQNSEIGYFYLEFGPATVRGWYDLCEVDSIREATDFAHEELGVPRHFLALSGTEGQGVVLYDSRSGAIYDVEFGQFEDLQSGVKEPIARSFSAYLSWCKAQDRGAR